MKIITLFILIISVSILESRIRKHKQLQKTPSSSKECTDEEYIEIFKSTIKEDPNHPEIKAYFDANVEINREKLLVLKRKKLFDINDDEKSAQQDIKKYYSSVDIKKHKYSDPEEYMRSGDKKFRLKDAREYVEALKLLEKDFNFHPKTILEVGAGQGRITNQVNAYYEKKNQNVEIDVLEPFEAQMKYLKMKNLSRVRNTYISKAEDFYCNEPKYDYIFGGMISNYIPDKYLPKFYIMIKSCLKNGGYIYFKEHIYLLHKDIAEEGQIFRPIKVLSEIMSLAGFTLIRLEESKIIDHVEKRSLKILAN